VIFNFLAMLYMVAPLVIIPLWAYHVGNWWLLVGIPVFCGETVACDQAELLICSNTD